MNSPVLAIIAAISENNVIGNDNKLPWRLLDDLSFFKKTTLNHAIIYGRNTLVSMGRVLPDRLNIVLSENPDFEPPSGVLVARSLADAMDLAHQNGHENVFAIGGRRIFEQALPLADLLYITHVRADVIGDVFFPDIDYSLWQLGQSQKIEQNERNNYAFDICCYTKKQN